MTAIDPELDRLSLAVAKLDYLLDQLAELIATYDTTLREDNQ